MKLFTAVRYFVSPSHTPEQRELVEHILLNNGAEQASNGAKDATHVITNSLRFEGWQDVEPDVVVVTSHWLERSMVLGKLQPPQFYSADPAMLFSGVIACATELPSQDLEVLSAGILALGGQWRTGLTKEVTHLFAISNSSAKYATALHYQEQTHVKVVLPHWFDDSVRLGVPSLATTPYEWPDPPLLRAADLNVAVDKVKKAMAIEHDPMKRALYSTAIKEGSEVKPVWAERRILISHSLELPEGRREAVEIGIQRAGGRIVPFPSTFEDEAAAVEDCDVYITRWRHGRPYVRAFRGHKTIGTLAWVYHVQSTGTMTRPLDQLLHYPIPKTPIDGFFQHEITVTNYTGEAREYLKKLIMTMGARFTPSMSGKNTVLIAASKEGIKAEKALSWSIPVVNHTWLEDCFVRWRNLTVATDKYLLFPEGLDFSTILGERGVGMGRVVEEEVEEMEEEMAEAEGAAQAQADVDVDVEMTTVVGATSEAGGGMDVHLDGAPQGTAASANEVQALVDVDGDAVMHDDGEASPREEEEEVEEEEDEPPLPPAKKKKKKKAEVEPDGEDEDEDEAVPKRGKVKKRVQSEPEEEDEDEVVEIPKPVEKALAKVISSEEESSEEEPNRKTASTSKKLAPATTSKATSKSKGKKKAPPPQSSSDSDDDVVEIVKNVRPKAKASVGEKGKGSVVEGEGSKSLLVKRKGDATMRLKKRVSKLVDDEDDEDEEDEEKVAPRKEQPAKKRGVVPKGSKGARKVTVDDEDDEEEEEEDEVVEKEAPARKVAKAAKAAREVSEDEDDEEEEEEERGRKAGKKATAASKSKPKVAPAVKTSKKVKGKARAVHSETEEEDESESEDEEDTVVVSHKKSAPSPKGKSKPTLKAKKIAPPPSPSPSRDQDEEDSDSSVPPETVLQPPSTSKKGTVTKTASNAQVKLKGKGKLSPKHTIAVLKPSFELAPKNKRKVVDEDGDDEEEQEEEEEEVPKKKAPRRRSSAGETLPTISKSNKTTTTAKPKSKAAAKPKSTVRPPLPPPPPIAPAAPLPSDSASVASAGPSKRLAATKATAKLHDEIMPDLVNFESQMRKSRKSGGGVTGFVVAGDTRAGEVVTAGKRKKSVNEEEGSTAAASAKGKKRQSVSEDEEDGGESRKRMKNADNAEAVSSKTNAGHSNKSTIRLATTQGALPEDVVKTLTKLGVVMTSKASECTHLLAVGVVRTEKFLCAIAAGAQILKREWALDSAKGKKLLPEKKYEMKDPDNRYALDLDETLARARAKKLMEGKVFYVSGKSLRASIPLLKNVVTACGGQVKEVQKLTQRLILAGPDRYAVSAQEDVSVWRQLAEQGSTVYSVEFILTGALHQKLDPDSYHLELVDGGS